MVFLLKILSKFFLFTWVFCFRCLQMEEESVSFPGVGVTYDCRCWKLSSARVAGSLNHISHLSSPEHKVFIFGHLAYFAWCKAFWSHPFSCKCCMGPVSDYFAYLSMLYLHFQPSYSVHVCTGYMGQGSQRTVWGRGTVFPLSLLSRGDNDASHHSGEVSKWAHLWVLEKGFWQAGPRKLRILGFPELY